MKHDPRLVNPPADEDMMVAAQAFVERLELRLPALNEKVFVGFRENGAASLFFGKDPVLQFTLGGQLRRLFFRGQRYAAERGTLTQICKRSTQGRVVLEKIACDLSSQSEMLEHLQQLIMTLADAIAQGQVTVERRHPTGQNVVAKVQSLCTRLMEQRLSVADSPGATP